MVWGLKSRQERGYGASWDRVRKVVIERDKGLCQMCLQKNRITPGKDVDHKKPKAECARLRWTKAQTDHPSNLWYLCRQCHLQKTEEEQGKTKHAPKPTIGEDGWPIE